MSRLLDGIEVDATEYAALVQSHADLLAALRGLVASLEWEKNRSGTTYNGFESARAALAKVLS